jgi:hypothetical protein
VSDGILGYRRFRYLWVALVLSAASVALFLSQYSNSSQPPNGGTWHGYVLGGLGAVLIVWLSLIGLRKRRYRASTHRLQGWTSAHVYLGSSLLIIVSLHSALQMGVNVHTVAYILMVIVVLSGIFGIYTYSVLPQVMIANRARRDPEVWARELEALDKQIRQLARQGDASLQQHVNGALELTGYGGGTLDTLLARDRSQLRLENGRVTSNRDQQLSIRTLAAAIPSASRRREAGLLTELLDAFGRRQALLRRLRRDAQLRALLRIWLFFHVPLSVALLAALTVHVLSVFIYW